MIRTKTNAVAKSVTKSVTTTLTLLGLAVVVSSSIGCSTPAYSGKERFQTIGRAISIEAAIMQDDIDSALLLRPNTLLTGYNGWNIARR